MNTLPPNVPVDVRTLLTYADETQENEAKKDKALMKKSEAVAFNGQIDAAKNSVTEGRKASNDRLQAAKDKSNGGIFGSIFGAIIAIAIIAVAAVFTGGALLVALIGLAAVVLGSGSSIGGLVGNKCAEGDEESANVAQEKSDALKVDEKELEKQAKECGDDYDKALDLLKQIRDGQRQRADEYRQSKIKG